MSSAHELKNLHRHIDPQPVEIKDEEVMTARQPAADREEMNRYILVEIGALHLAIAIDDLAEVGPLPTITALPNLPDWIPGIVNIRSEIVSIVDIAGFLGITGRAICNGNRFAVLRHKKQKIGLRLDRIIGTVNKAVSEKQPLDAEARNSFDAGLFTSGLLVDKRVYYILGVRRFLSAPRLVNYNNIEK